MPPSLHETLDTWSWQTTSTLTVHVHVSGLASFYMYGIGWLTFKNGWRY